MHTNSNFVKVPAKAVKPLAEVNFGAALSKLERTHTPSFKATKKARTKKTHSVNTSAW